MKIIRTQFTYKIFEDVLKGDISTINGIKLPQDIVLIHVEHYPSRRVIELYFQSAKGEELLEGADMRNLPIWKE